MTAQNADTVSTGQNVAENNEQPGLFFRAFNIILRIVFTILISRLFASFMNRNNQNYENPSLNGTSTVAMYSNLYNDNTLFNYWFYLYEKDSTGNIRTEPFYIWRLKELKFLDWYSGPNKNSTYSFSYKYNVSDIVSNNGTLSFIACVTTNNRLPPLSIKKLNTPVYSCIDDDITSYRKIKVNKEHNLLDTSSLELKNDENLDNEEDLAVTHINPSITVAMIFDNSKVSSNSFPHQINKHFTYNPDKKIYYPVLYHHTFWKLNSDYFPINETVKTINLDLSFHPLSLIKWQLFLAQSEQHQFSFMQAYQTEEEMDNFKLLFLETNFYVLVLTFSISILHSIFEFFAFKNDIQFWNSRKSHEGLSIHSILFSIFQSVIVLLYVLDNEANVMVIIGCVIASLIDIWKLSKIFKISINIGGTNGSRFGFSIIKIAFKSQEFAESKSNEYDKLAFKYLSLFLFPCLGCYSIYSLIYHTHRSWYSFILGTIYSFLLAFGFIMMTPQLFINYKMKSVAHLPWRMMTYKALNTFVDDIFAFVIKMPTLYRLGCFRDDVVFVIFLYQKWIYPVDKKRVNEFGTTGEDYSNSTSMKIDSKDKKSIKSE